MANKNKKTKQYQSLFLALVLMFNVLAGATLPVVTYAQETAESEAVAETPTNVSDIIALNNNKEQVRVTGYIIGYAMSSTNIAKDDFSHQNANTNLVIADRPDETDYQKNVVRATVRKF